MQDNNKTPYEQILEKNQKIREKAEKEQMEREKAVGKLFSDDETRELSDIKSYDNDFPNYTISINITEKNKKEILTILKEEYDNRNVEPITACFVSYLNSIYSKQIGHLGEPMSLKCVSLEAANKLFQKLKRWHPKINSYTYG